MASLQLLPRERLRQLGRLLWLWRTSYRVTCRNIEQPILSLTVQSNQILQNKAFSQLRNLQARWVGLVETLE